MSGDRVIIQPLVSAPLLPYARGVVYERVLKLLQCDSKAVPSFPNQDELKQNKIIKTNQSLVYCDINGPQLYTESQIGHLLTGLREIGMLVATSDGNDITHINKHTETSSINNSGNKSIYIAVSNGGRLSCIRLHDTSSVRFVIKKLLEESVHIICYDVHQLLLFLYNQYNLTPVGLHFLDIKFAVHLLSPDNPVTALQELSQQCNNSLMETSLWVCWELSRLGPLMALLYHKLQENKLWSIYVNLEMKIAPVLATMEYIGLQINVDKLIYYSDVIKTQLKTLEYEAYSLIGHEFSLNSTNQLREVLFNELQLDLKCQQSLHKTSVQKLTSTSEPVLKQLSDHHPLPGIVLQYRQLCKLKAFVDSLLSCSYGQTLKPNWLACGTVTGRLSCCNPNIQAFPKQVYHFSRSGVLKSTEIVIDVRAAVVSRTTMSFVSLDFKSIELRLLAHFSGDVSLNQILSRKSSFDVFQLLASQWFGSKPEEVSVIDREKAKRTVYAIVYGIGKDKLAENLQVTIDTAQELIKSFLTKFPAIQNFVQSVLDHCRKTSSAADVCKVTMFKIFNVLRECSPSSRLLMQIHDELLYEVPDGDVPIVSNKLKELAELPHLLEGYCDVLKVPLAVRISSGKNWSEMQPILFT